MTLNHIHREKKGSVLGGTKVFVLSERPEPKRTAALTGQHLSSACWIRLAALSAIPAVPMPEGHRKLLNLDTGLRPDIACRHFRFIKFSFAVDVSCNFVSAVRAT